MIKCPICDYSAMNFSPFGRIPREDARCPRCGSLERHRLLWLFFQRKTALFSDQLRVIHFSPMSCFAARLSKKKNLDYNTVDIKEGYDHQFDIQEIPETIGKFDVILAIHVLEHIDDDILAMREMKRILNPGGWAILQVPINRKKTKENPTDVSLRKGQKDHVRGYGPDYLDRLKSAGLDVDVVPFDSFISDSEATMYNTTKEDIYLCR